MIQIQKLIIGSLLVFTWVSLIQSQIYSSVSPLQVANPYMRAGNQDIISTLTGPNFYSNYTFIFSSPLPGVPNLVYGIKRYQGNHCQYRKGYDGLLQQSFEIRKVALNTTSFKVQVGMAGYAALYFLNVPYLAVDPNFPHHLNSFDDIPINYGSTLVFFHNICQTNITSLSKDITFYSNDINYTLQASGRPFKTFAAPLASNKIVVYITSLQIYGSYNPIDIHINYTILTSSIYRLSVSLSMKVLIYKLQLSIIVFNSDDVQSSKKYTIVHDIWETNNLGGFIEVPSASINNFILGLSDFSTLDGYCVFSYAWGFANVSGKSGVKLEVSKPVDGSSFSCSLSRIRSTVFYMKTWQCTLDHPYFNSTTNLCQDACGLLYYANTSIYECKRCEFACRECVNSTFCTKCDDVNDFRTLTNNSGKVSCLCSPRYHQDPLNSTNTVCLPCMANCLSCRNSTVCDGCDSLANYVLTPSNTCEICGYGCLSCNKSPYECVSCTTGMIADNTQQRCVCLPGTYASNLTVICLACDWTCATCSGPLSTDCLTCKNQTIFDIFQHKCVSPTVPFIFDMNASLTCHWTCETCSGPLSTDCFTCKNQTIFDNVQQKCICFARTFNSDLNASCAVCHWTCTTCSGPLGSDCLSCNNITIFDGVQQKCMCLAGTFNADLNASCLACHWTCATCTGPSSTECLQCSIVTIFDNVQQKCICLIGTFNSDLDESCLTCHWTCASCSGPLSTQCFLCKNETAFDNFQHKCICLAGTFNSDSNASCVACHWTCSTCSGPSSTDCLSCNNGTIFDSVQQECICFDGTYNSDLSSSCLNCHTICAKCTGPSSSECLAFNLLPVQNISSQKIENFKEFMDSTFDSPVFSFVNHLPGGRKMMGPLFSFLLNFDDFWLYNYHQRNYSEVIQSLMDKINDMEAQKWSLIQYQKIFDALGFNKENFQNFLSAKTSFTSKKFFDIQDNSNGFFPNTPNFLFSNVFITLLVFIVMKNIHMIVRHFKIAQILIEYSFWPFYFLMIIEGNLQYFSYILTFDMMKFFELTYEYKFLNIVTLFIIFGIFFFGGFSYFILKFHYGTRTKYLLADVKNNLIGIVYVSTVIGLRNIFIGVIHYFFEEHYHTKISCLISIETIFISIYFIVLYDKFLSSMIYSKGKIWFFSIFPGLIRIILNFTFLLTYENSALQKESIYIAFAEIQMALIYCYMGLFMFVAFVQILRSLVEIITYLYKKYRHMQQSSKASRLSLQQKIKYPICSQPSLKIRFDTSLYKTNKHNHVGIFPLRSVKLQTKQTNVHVVHMQDEQQAQVVQNNHQEEIYDRRKEMFKTKKLKQKTHYQNLFY